MRLVKVSKKRRKVLATSRHPIFFRYSFGSKKYEYVIELYGLDPQERYQVLMTLEQFEQCSKEIAKIKLP